MPDPQPPTRREPPDAEPLVIGAPVSIRSAALTAIVVLVTIIILQSAQQVLIPIVLAILISYLLSPVVWMLARIGMPRALGALVVVVLLVAALGAGVWSVSDDALRLIDSMPEAARTLRDTLRRQRDESALQKVQEAAQELERTAAEAALPTRAPSGVQRVQIVEPAVDITQYLWWGSMGLLGFASQLAMILFLVYFLLAAGDLYKRKLVKIGGDRLGRQRVTVEILDDFNRQIERFLATLLVTSVLVAAATAATLWWLGFREWLFWGIAAGVFNTIPYFGPLIVSSGLAVVGFLQFGALRPTLNVAGAALVITSLEGWLLTPALMGKAGRMNPVAIFIGLLFWSWVWGPWGVVLAVPMMMLLKAVCDRLEELQPFGELLGE